MAETQKTTFALGCFWHPDEYFSKLPGVVRTRVGYAGGEMPDPTYENVCGGGTGHSEAVEIEFDPEKISYKELLEHFFNQHDPAEKQKTQYASVIFTHSDEQRAGAEESKRAQQEKSRKPVLTDIRSVEPFHEAEDYHQKYYEKLRKR